MIPSLMPDLSIIIPTHNEGESLFLTVEALLHTCPDEIEIVVVNDASTDGSLDFLADGDRPRVRRLDLPRQGISGARNYGARHARGETLVFLDAHCIPKRNWLPPLLRALDHDPDGIVTPCVSVLGHTLSKGYGANLSGPDLGFQWRCTPDSPDPHPVPLACGCCMAMRREYFFELAGFDRIRTYGMEDVEICLRTWLLGGSVRVVPESEVAHLFKTSAQYHVDGCDFLSNRLRVAILHFDGERYDCLLALFRKDPAFDQAMALLEKSDVWKRRDRFRSLRQRDADWFCDRFEVAI